MFIYGKQTVQWICEQHADLVEKVYISKDLDKKEYNFFMHSFSTQRINLQSADKMVGNTNHQNYIAQVKPPKPIKAQELKKLAFVLVFDNLSNMGNMGAIVRSAYVLGVDAIIFCGQNELKIDRLAKTSVGSIYSLPFLHYKNVNNAINELKLADFLLFGACMDGQVDFETPVNQKRALILGREDEGITKRIEKKLDKKIAIRMKREFNSLNVAAAASILIEKLG